MEDAGFDGRLLGPGAERGTARLHVDGMICSDCRCAGMSQLVVVSAPLLPLQGAAACCAGAHVACSFPRFGELYLAFKPPTGYGAGRTRSSSPGPVARPVARSLGNQLMYQRHGGTPQKAVSACAAARSSRPCSGSRACWKPRSAS